MTTNEFLNEFLVLERLNSWPYPFQVLRPMVVCKDGFKVSIQASAGHYCYPRIDTDRSIPYEKVELGFPSEAVPEWLEYAEEQYDPTDTVYGYVPVELVDIGLAKHGGIDLEKMKEHYIQSMTEAERTTEEQYNKFCEIFRKLGAE